MNSPAQTPWQMFGDPDRKRKFAALARVRPDTREGRFEAACLVFPDDVDTQTCMRAMEEWPRDPIVIEELVRLAKSEKADDLPSKEEQARDVYNLARDNTKSLDDRLKAHKLYADLMGFVQKPTGAPVQVNFNDNRRVMLMPAPANSLDDWEADAVQHQTKLVSDAASTLSKR